MCLTKRGQGSRLMMEHTVFATWRLRSIWQSEAPITPRERAFLIGFGLFVTSIMAVYCWQVVGGSEWPGGRHGDGGWWLNVAVGGGIWRAILALATSYSVVLGNTRWYYRVTWSYSVILPSHSVILPSHLVTLLGNITKSLGNITESPSNITKWLGNTQ